MKRGVLCGAAALGVVLGGCRPGVGSGQATGPLFIISCTGDSNSRMDRGSREAPAWYQLDPGFFGGEPIIDIGQGPKVNRLIIRLQTTGRRRETEDVLTFNIFNMREVARCMRGRINPDGTPDFKQDQCTPGPAGARLRLAPDALIAADLKPFLTCSRPIGASAISPPQLPAWQSFIDLVDFGDAAGAGVPDTRPSPELRPAVGGDFAVKFGDRLRAAGFVLQLEDDAVVRGYRRPEDAEIGGVLNGEFDFVMARGQGAQTFP